MSPSISVPDVQAESLLLLIKDYANCQCDIEFTRNPQSSTIELKTVEGKRLRGGIAAARYLASQGSRANQLLGDSIEQSSKIAEIISLTRFMSAEILDDQLEVFNNWLKSRTFLVGNKVTLADLVLYANLSSAMKNLPAAQHMHFCNILRWYENMHHKVDGGKVFPAVSFKKSKFNFCPPVVKSSHEAGNDSTQKNAKKIDAKVAPNESKKSEKLSEKVVKEDSEKSGSKNNKPAKKEKGGSKEEPTIDFLDIRVGLIKSIAPHPNADALYVEEIDLGEEKPRTVVSGLRKFVSEDAMKNRKVAVVCNLKPAKMRDIMSFGMVLCASNADHSIVEPVLIPEGSAIGSRITCAGFDREPEVQINPKKKIFEKIAPYLVTDKGMFPSLKC